MVTWATVVEFVPVYFEPFLGLPSWTNSLNSVDLNTQVNAYKQSIKDGHGVIVVAHSQGNFFYPRAPSLEQAQFTLTNSAYLRLDSWMRPYFNMIGVAFPFNSVMRGGFF